MLHQILLVQSAHQNLMVNRLIMIFPIQWPYTEVVSTELKTCMGFIVKDLPSESQPGNLDIMDI